MYFSDFQWNDYCFQDRDPSVCVQRIPEVIVFGMEAYIHALSLPLMLKSLGLITFVLVLSKTVRMLRKRTRAFDSH